jgi:hypothetical protein
MDASEFSTGTACCALHTSPMMLWVLLLLVLALAFGTYALGILIERRDAKRRDADVADSIVKAIRAKAGDARLAAPANVAYFAQALVDEIELRLGPVLKLGDRLGGPVKKLKAALDALLRPTPPKPQAPKPAAKAGESAGAHQVNLAHSVAVIVNGESGAPGATPAAPAPQDPVEAVRTAVYAVADYVVSDDFPADLKAARKALNTPAPVSTSGRGR